MFEYLTEHHNIYTTNKSIFEFNDVPYVCESFIWEGFLEQYEWSKNYFFHSAFLRPSGSGLGVRSCQIRQFAVLPKRDSGNRFEIDTTPQFEIL